MNEWIKHFYIFYRCAFINTPKYNEAKRQGAYRVVKSDWIDKCHSNKCRFPWRRSLYKNTRLIDYVIFKSEN